MHCEIVNFKLNYHGKNSHTIALLNSHLVLVRDLKGVGEHIIDKERFQPFCEYALGKTNMCSLTSHR